MRDEQIPIMLTNQQITTIQDIILEKQYELATEQSDCEDSACSSRLRVKMSQITDLLMALNMALPESREQQTRAASHPSVQA